MTARSELLVSPQWLSERLGQPKLRIVDGSWYLPAQGRNARADYLDGHIPGAVFFDIDAIADRNTDLPHMLPSPGEFAEAAGRLGISDSDTIVVYDGLGLFSAARVWWTFRAFGARDVRVLEGGMPAWKAAGLPLERGEPEISGARFQPSDPGAWIASLATVRERLGSDPASIVDARPAPRFEGAAPEPRPGLRSGHIPGSRNLPFDRLLDTSGSLAPAEEIKAAFADAGADLTRPLVATCGSGVTAAIPIFALATLGKTDAALYDGSWAEWGARSDMPVETGPA